MMERVRVYQVLLGMELCKLGTTHGHKYEDGITPAHRESELNSV